MTRRLLPCPLLAGSLLFASAVYAQAPAPTQQATAPAQSAHQTPTAAAAVPTLRANTRIVVVDVVVTDQRENAVHNLKASDFTLMEKGQAQTIAHFEEHSTANVAAAKMPPMPKMESGTFTNYSPTPANGALNILLLDGLNTPLQDQAYVRQQMLKYLQTPRPGTRMAVFGLGQRLHLLQGFTTDPELLRSVVSSKKSMTASPMMENAVSGDTVGQDTAASQLIDQMGNDPSMAQMVAQLQQFTAETTSFQTMLRTRYTLDAMNLLGRYLSGLPGRKNLIWFSGSFPVNILPDGDLQNPFAVEASMEDEFHETINLLSRSQVSVYPIDARGLMPLPMMDAANSGAKYAKNPTAMAKDQSKFFQQTAEEHSTMNQMAQDTGGKAFVNTNGLKEAVEKAVDAGSNYYTLTYVPTNRNWKGDYRKIEVKLAQQGYKLAYRRGYYADDPDAHVTSTRREAAATAVPFDALRSAMQWGGPDPTEILFETVIMPATDTTEPELIKDNQAAPKVTGPFRRYIVYFVADPRAITAVETAGGQHHIDLEFVSFIYSNEGVLTTWVTKHVSVNLSAEQYKSAMQAGVRFRQEISVPVKGKYFLRAGLQDLATQRVGALEIDVEAVSKLKSLAAQQAAAPAMVPTKP